jgi:hypothetical protein
MSNELKLKEVFKNIFQIEISPPDIEVDRLACRYSEVGRACLL